MLDDHQRLSTLITELVQRFRNHLIIHMIDPQSLHGIIKSLRYRVRTYPTFIVNGQAKVMGWDPDLLVEILESSVQTID